MIGITADFSDDDLEKVIQEDLEAWFMNLSRSMMDTGKLLIDKAISKVSYDSYGKVFGNITFNLRSSMGCGLVLHGKVIETYFPFGKNDEGKRHGLQLLKKVASETEEDFFLVVVAGEVYSNYVQDNGYDVDNMSLALFGDEFLRKIS